MTWSWPAFGLGVLVGVVGICVLGAAVVSFSDPPKLRVLDGGKAPPRPPSPPVTPVPEPEPT